MNTNPPGEPQSNMYQQSTLPDLAPANSFSPSAPQDQAMLTSSFRISSSTPQALGAPGLQPDPRHPLSSPTADSQHPGMSYQLPSQPRAPSLSNSTETNGLRPGPSTRPVRPAPPFDQFTDHMRPQLEADYFEMDQIPARIQMEWDGLSLENRKLWDDRYQDQMREYTAAMDAYKRATRREASGGAFPPMNS